MQVKIVGSPKEVYDIGTKFFPDEDSGLEQMTSNVDPDKFCSITLSGNFNGMTQNQLWHELNSNGIHVCIATEEFAKKFRKEYGNIQSGDWCAVPRSTMKL